MDASSFCSSSFYRDKHTQHSLVVIVHTCTLYIVHVLKCTCVCSYMYVLEAAFSVHRTAFMYN